MAASVKIERYADLARWILGRPSDHARLAAVDGPGGAGKSVFALRLATALGAPVVHTDDFATGEPGDEWWPRLQAKVIDPLLAGRPARYRRYDWNRRKFAEWFEIQPVPAVIIEGVSSARREAAEVLSCAIWVHAPRAIRLQRGLDRDGESARAAWNRWMAEEDEHFRRDATIDRCEVFVDGSPTISHDPALEFARLASCSYD